MLTQQYWIRKPNTIGECERPAGTPAHIFSITPGGKPTTGMISENIVISNVPKCLRRSGKIKYPFDLPSPTNTKIFKCNY